MTMEDKLEQRKRQKRNVFQKTKGVRVLNRPAKTHDEPYVEIKAKPKCMIINRIYSWIKDKLS
jgi:hypothetical protein